MERRTTMKPVHLLQLLLRYTHTHLVIKWFKPITTSKSLFVDFGVNLLIRARRRRRLQSLQVWRLSSCLMGEQCRSKGSSRPLRPRSFSHHRFRQSRWEQARPLPPFRLLFSKTETSLSCKILIISTTLQAVWLYQYQQDPLCSPLAFKSVFKSFKTSPSQISCHPSQVQIKPQLCQSRFQV